MNGSRYDVRPRPHNAQQLQLHPLTITLNGVPGCSPVGARTFPLNWGICAFQEALLSGAFSLD